MGKQSWCRYSIDNIQAYQQESAPIPKSFYMLVWKEKAGVINPQPVIWNQVLSVEKKWENFIQHRQNDALNLLSVLFCYAPLASV